MAASFLMQLHLLATVAYCATADYPPWRVNPLGPGKGPWVEDDPLQHGLDPKVLAAAKEEVFKIHRRHCMVVIKNGALVYEAYDSLHKEHSKDLAVTGYSMTKTLGALIAGEAVGRGKLDIDADITKTYGVKSPRPYPVTARQIMSQALDGTSRPGEAWAYDAIGNRWINHLAKVVTAAAEKPSGLWQNQFHEPLGLADNFKIGPIDHTFAYGASGTCRDWARIGQLMLNEGRWLGVNDIIVPANYVKEMITPQTKYAPYQNYSNPSYGLLTWLNPRLNETAEYPGVSKIAPKDVVPPEDSMPTGLDKNTYYLGGALGQVVMVVPSDNLVAVSMGLSPHIDYGALSVAVQMAKSLCPLLKGCKPNATMDSASVLV